MMQLKPKAISRILPLLRYYRRRMWFDKIERFRVKYKKRPAPLDLCIKLERCGTKILGKCNPLFPPLPQLFRNGEYLSDIELAEIFRGIELGNWSMSVNTIDWIVDFLYKYRPRTVLEFGSGLSTACLCLILQRIHGPQNFRLLSLDQSPEEVEQTVSKINSLDGFSSCRVIHVPLIPGTADNRSTFFYNIAGMSEEHFAWLGKAEFVLIDGPDSKGPGRYGTLHQVRSYLAEGARFAMDDGLREKELFLSSLWVQEGILIDGVITHGKGLMIGTIP